MAELTLLLDLEPRGGDRFIGRRQPDAAGRVFGGQAQPMESRQTKLARRYLPGRDRTRLPEEYPR